MQGEGENEAGKYYNDGGDENFSFVSVPSTLMLGARLDVLVKDLALRQDIFLYLRC